MSVWREVTLGDLERESEGVIQTGPFGSQLHMSDYTQTGTPVVMPTNIRSLRLDPANIARVTEDHVLRLSRHQLRAGDIVYSRRGDVEKCALVTEQEDGWLCGTGCLLVRLGGPNIDSRFLSYSLALPSTRAWITQHTVGATMPNLNTGIIREVPVRLPEIGVQRAIAATLGALDDKIESNRRAGEIIQTLTAAHFELWRQHHGEGTQTTFGDFVDVLGGTTPKTRVPEYWGGPHAWATPTDLTRLESPYLLTTDRAITDAALASANIAIHPPGSILMTSRATIGAFAVNQVPTATNQGFIVARPHRPQDRWFIFEEMRSRVDEFIGQANGSTFLELSRGRFKTLRLVIPDDQAILELDRVLDPLHAKASQLAVENGALATLRDALLPALLSGRIKVSEARETIEETIDEEVPHA